MLADIPSNIHGNVFTITANSGDTNRNGVKVILVIDPVAELVRVYNYENHYTKKADALMFIIEDITMINENFGGVYIEGSVKASAKLSFHTWIKAVNDELDIL